jgi:hypothetical protein
MSDTTNAVSDQTRTVHGVLFHLFILQFSISTAAGHLGTLRKSSGAAHCWFVVLSIVVPLVPLVDTLRFVLFTVRNRQHVWGNGLLYFLNCISGASFLHQEFGTPIPLALASKPVELNEDRPRLSWKLIGRTIVLLATFAQVIATLYLVLRRAYFAGLSPVDIHALFCCLSGVVIVLSSLFIQLWEDRWRITTLPTADAVKETNVLRSYLPTAYTAVCIFIVIYVAQFLRAGDESAWRWVVPVLSVIYPVLAVFEVRDIYYLGEDRKFSGLYVWCLPAAVLLEWSTYFGGFAIWGWIDFTVGWPWYDPLSDLLWVY